MKQYIFSLNRISKNYFPTLKLNNGLMIQNVFCKYIDRVKIGKGEKAFFILFKVIFVLFFLSITVCKAQDDLGQHPNEDNWMLVEKHFDSESSTNYFLINIKNKDQNGKLLKLKHAHTIKESGESVLDFAKRMDNPMIAINATQSSSKEGKMKAIDTQIINGEVIQDERTSYYAYTLGIKENNELSAFKKEVTATEILNTGVTNALSGFVPLIEKHKAVSASVLEGTKAIQKKHPRQVIAQFENLDLLILSCGGRGYDGNGMSADDVIRILLEKGVKFAFMLDGGGSTSTVVNGKLITKRIDSKGTKDRLRANFLYIQ